MRASHRPCEPNRSAKPTQLHLDHSKSRLQPGMRASLVYKALSPSALFVIHWLSAFGSRTHRRSLAAPGFPVLSGVEGSPAIAPPYIKGFSPARTILSLFRFSFANRAFQGRNSQSTLHARNSLKRKPHANQRAEHRGASSRAQFSALISDFQPLISRTYPRHLTSRITCKLLKMLADAPIYPTHFSSPDVAQLPSPNRLGVKLLALSLQVPECA